MKEIGFSDNEIEQVITLIASILHIGDIVSFNFIMIHNYGNM